VAASFISNRAACAPDRAALSHADRHRAEGSAGEWRGIPSGRPPPHFVSGTEQTQWNINRSLYVGEGVVLFSGEWGFLPAWGQL
jgi:hypothetical protein